MGRELLEEAKDRFLGWTWTPYSPDLNRGSVADAVPLVEGSLDEPGEMVDQGRPDWYRALTNVRP